MYADDADGRARTNEQVVPSGDARS